MPKLILASASPRRKDLLKQIGLEFEAYPADIDENSLGYMDAGKYAEEMSRRKALMVAKDFYGATDEEHLILGADTTVEIDGTILGKPEDYDDAVRMLESIQGKWHRVITGITLVNAKNREVLTDSEMTRVKIRSMTPEMIQAYLRTGESLDKAGAYGAQGYGSLIVERVEGCFFNVIGLPIYKLSRLLEQQGFKMLSWFRG
ncbi:MAG: septum formation protein Maf [Clostridiaceae bacterium]|jgi:septum formation protein|nr:Maf family protein [Bacillota bacterium]NLI39309.1 septum formation protein Maf [Clostridiaceae bacterium]